jgi:hypothetical protein
MLDLQKWKIAVARFNGYSANIPSFIKTDNVEDYHAIVTALEQASGQDLSNFKIPADKLKPKVLSVRPAPYGGGRGSATYSQDKYCDSNFFEAQIDALKHYLPNIQTSTQPKTQYDDLYDWQLQELMMKRGIKPPRSSDSRHEKMPAREYIIAALVKQDTPPPPLHSTTLNVYDSNVNYGSPGATITSHIAGFNKEEFSSLIDGLRQLLSDSHLDQSSKDEVNINIGTIELQLTSARPNVSIVRESLRSLKFILENAAGSLIASGLLPTVHHILSKL